MCYWWGMELKVGHDVSFGNVYVWKEIREKAGEFNGTEA
jgi:hypothetical protein